MTLLQEALGEGEEDTFLLHRAQTRAESRGRCRKILEVPPVSREANLILFGAQDSEKPRLAAKSVPQMYIQGFLMSKELYIKPGKEDSIGLIPEAETRVLFPENPKTSISERKYAGWPSSTNL